MAWTCPAAPISTRKVHILEFGGSFLLKCNYDVKFLPKTLPKFYKECLNEWASYKEMHISTPLNVLNEIIWNNKFICIGGKPLFRKKIAKKSIIKLCDLMLNDTGKLKTWDILKNKNITMAEYTGYKRHMLIPTILKTFFLLLRGCYIGIL